MPRIARAAQTRGYQSRRAEAREPATSGINDPLWVDQRKKPADMEYAWIRRAVGNMEDSLNIRKRQLQGWKPVPPDRHPELTPAGWGLESENRPRSYIENAGLILCECPRRDFARRKREIEEETHDALQMPNFSGDPQAKSLPTFQDSGVGFERITSEKVGGEEFKE